MANETRLSLRAKVRQNLLSWPDASPTLVADITAGALTFTVSSAIGLDVGMVLQIEDEIVRIMDKAGAVLTLMRGDRGTTAAAHLAGTACYAFPSFGWTDAEVNSALDRAFDWIHPDVWYPKYYVNTVAAHVKEFGCPPGVRNPDGELVMQLEFLNNDSQWYVVYNWRHTSDRLILDQILGNARDVRMMTRGKHARLTDDTTQMYSNEPTDCLVSYSTKLCLEALLGNRPKYVEYSAALNDRASTPDELQRTIYYFYNQAVLAKERASRVAPATFASVRRGG
jgi:hypothetical protein